MALGIPGRNYSHDLTPPGHVSTASLAECVCSQRFRLFLFHLVPIVPSMRCTPTAPIHWKTWSQMTTGLFKAGLRLVRICACLGPPLGPRGPRRQHVLGDLGLLWALTRTFGEITRRLRTLTRTFLQITHALGRAVAPPLAALGLPPAHLGPPLALFRPSWGTRGGWELWFSGL